jgi:HlyD family secretion protein
MRITPHVAVLALCSALFLGCSGNSRDVIEASGTIEGTDINIGSEVLGRVNELRVTEGSRVNPGDTLLVIDDTEYRLQLAGARANLAAQDAAYRLAVKGSRNEDIAQAEAAYRTTQADYQRMKELLASQTVTQKQYDDAYSRYVTAEQTYNKLKTGLRPEEIESARVKRDQAVSQVDLLRKKVRDCTIIAPSKATVTLKGVEPGELVTVGMNVLRLTYLDKIKLTIYVSETELGRVKLGQPADILIDTFGPDRPFKGVVTYISPVAEFTPKNVQTKEERSKLVFGVKIEAENPEGLLKPGLPADARIHAPQQTGS